MKIRYSAPRYSLFPEIDICVIDFATLFATRIKDELVEQLDFYKLNWQFESCATAKRLIKHYVILGVCERIRKANAHGHLKTIIYANLEELEEVRVSNHPYFNRCIWHTLKDIYKKLPIRIYFSDYSYSDFVNPNIASGLVKDVKSELSTIADKDFSGYTFDKIKKYAEKEKLTYLNESYFKNLKSRLIMSM